MNLVDLGGKRAMVCGSTQGIGRASAELMAGLGAEVVLVARDAGKLEEVVGGLLCDAGQRHAFVSVDFSNPHSVRNGVESHISRHGPVDILVNNTGGPKSGPILEAQIEEFSTAFAMHVQCNHALVQTTAPGMKSRGYGRIINIVSTSVREPIPGLGVSNTIRAAVAGWAKTLAGELAPFGITVNNVLPGYTETARLRSLIDARAARQNAAADEIERSMKAQTPMRRFGSVNEIAAAVAFLASPAASYITGVSLPVDGGRIASL
jgi:3-oxoacyl-[acyl-carrier protein] reductase